MPGETISSVGYGHELYLQYSRAVIHKTLQWFLNERERVSNHLRPDCLITVYSGADQRKHQSSVSLAFVKGSTGDQPLMKPFWLG